MMRHGWLCFAIVLLLGGCVTPQDRAAEYPEVFAALSEAEQVKVLDGEVETGMPEGAVLIALGKPSYTREGEFEGLPVDGWVYERVETERIPHYRISTHLDAQGNAVATEVYDPIIKQQWVPKFIIYVRDGFVVGRQDL